MHFTDTFPSFPFKINFPGATIVRLGRGPCPRLVSEEVVDYNSDLEINEPAGTGSPSQPENLIMVNF